MDVEKCPVKIISICQIEIILTGIFAMPEQLTAALKVSPDIYLYDIYSRNIYVYCLHLMVSYVFKLLCGLLLRGLCVCKRTYDTRFTPSV